MKKFLNILLPILIIVGLAGCNSFTGGINNNPNNATSATAEKYSIGAQTAADLFFEGFPDQLATMICRQTNGAARQFSGYENYQNLNGQAFSDDWGTVYQGALNNLKIAENEARKDGNKNLVAVDHVIEGLTMGTVASLWGDVPYKDAVQPNMTLTPHYDHQLDVFTEVQDTLSNAITQLEANAGKSLASGVDVWSYGGDLTMWAKAANTLKARYLMLVAAHNGYKQADLQAVIAAAQKGLSATDGSEDLSIPHGTVQHGNQNLWYSFLVVDRASYMDASKNNAYILMTDPARENAKTDDSLRAAYFYTPGGQDLNTTDGAFTASSSFTLVRASESYLLMAEAYERMGDDTNALINLNMARQYDHNVYGGTYSDLTVADFLVGGVYANSSIMQQILDEEYLSHLMQIDVFNFCRRVKFKVTDLSLPTGKTQFIQRYMYPQSEISANPNTPTETATDLFKALPVYQ